MNERSSVNITDGGADVRLTRGDKLNALDKQMLVALGETGAALGADKNVRVVVISGEGKAFCAGLDKSTFGLLVSDDSPLNDQSKEQGMLEPRTHGIANHPQYATWVWRELPVPVIAAVHGAAVGGGFQLMLGADMRYVTPDARLSVMEVNWGLVPDMGGTPIMCRLAREDIVRELVYPGRLFSGTEALEYGFATRVMSDPLTAALETAREIAGKSPDAIRANKRIFQAANYANAADALLRESIEQDRIIAGENLMEAISSNMAERPPKFTDWEFVEAPKTEADTSLLDNM